VFAVTAIAKGEVILHIDDSIVVRRDDPVLSKLIGGEPDPCDYLPDGTIILMQEPERYINHSCDPNVYIYTLDKDRFVVGMRDIAGGEELTFDYAIDVVGGDWLDCLCGSPKCRGGHRPDFFLLPVAKQLEYLPYLSTGFVQAHRERVLRLLEGGKPSALGDRGEEPQPH
jgi:hypothetical protein